MKRYILTIKGVVQAVGFRPFIYRLACSLGLVGTVINHGAGVIVDLEGTEIQLRLFLNRLNVEAPVQAKIVSVEIEEKPVKGYNRFEIGASKDQNIDCVFIPPDLSICAECEAELFQEGNRRYLYPFINCMHCGPRFTIIRRLPYDRVSTTMSEFPMCPPCLDEYNEPANRRYHAQPIACFDCGPTLEIRTQTGDQVAAGNNSQIIQTIQALIRAGKIIALKGIGGYHLVCDAWNEKAIETLRQRKHRDEKPFALMAKNYLTALKYCQISKTEKELLESPQKPIVLLQKKMDCSLPENIAPQNAYLGIMLPYTPLHMLIFHAFENNQSPVDLLVVTSANISGEPILFRDQEAQDRLKNIADYFLMHNREILKGVDDSVTRVFQGKEYPVRRSRGYVPLPIDCQVAEFLWGNYKSPVPTVLACGGELKSTFCLNRGTQFYLSQHLGDLENTATYQLFEDEIVHFQKMLGVKPLAVAYDLHPDYLSTDYALATDIQEKIPVQHHHAHIASCMVEHHLNEAVIGVAFDGTGYGEDGAIWGGEFFTGSYSGFTRMGHLENVMMPGGNLAIKEPWRMALSYLVAAGLNDFRENKCFGIGVKNINCFMDVESDKINIVLQMLEKKINSPLTSSAGRFFDAVSALIGIRSTIGYEGQAAMELEYIAGGRITNAYEFSLDIKDNLFVVKTQAVIQGIITDLMNNSSKETIAAKFHHTLTEMILKSCELIRKRTGISKVVLSGGVFQNLFLLEESVKRLENSCFQVYTHSKTPTNDGGISLGQAMIALAKLKNKYS